MTPHESALALVRSLRAEGVSADEAARTAAALAIGPASEKLLSTAELAALVGRSTTTVNRWAQGDLIPVVRIGGHVVGVHFPSFLKGTVKGLAA
jgi:hypothetical protein